jgi:hypothetical protein
MAAGEVGSGTMAKRDSWEHDPNAVEAEALWFPPFRLDLVGQQEGGGSRADGSFDLALGPGTHQLTVQADGYSSGWRQVWAPSIGVDVVLEPAARLIGIVRAAGTDDAVARVTVSAVGTMAFGTPAASAITESDGFFGISNSSAGDYYVRAEGAGWLSEWQLVTIHLGQETGPVEFEVSRVTSLQGRVSVAGAPCRAGHVILFGPVSATGDVRPDGTVTIAGLRPGSYQADVRCPPGAPTIEDIDVELEPALRA